MSKWRFDEKKNHVLKDNFLVLEHVSSSSLDLFMARKKKKWRETHILPILIFLFPCRYLHALAVQCRVSFTN